MRSVLVQVIGRVQGVWFRDWTRRKAVSLGLAGWVRNRLDHSVEARFEGPSLVVDEMIANCRKGSKLSRVEDVLMLEDEQLDEHDNGSQIFEIRKTL